MRLVIDYKKCRKAGQCYLHPELFQADEAGAPVVLLGHLAGCGKTSISQSRSIY